MADNRIANVLTKLDARMARHLAGKEGAREETGTRLEQVLMSSVEEPLVAEYVDRASVYVRIRSII